ncbi:transforming growth factor-beta receptor-associated protein 1 [Dunckerocampus dactyliophorus]|uniref:transforming growth factor-beta receptor-associated protein 1 n=1 Tax=Dunckerocampus dactyliophorus TaxID=161453 RepID=UPI0024076CD1|nr:transforming growth factor-beta receptor-associated protein 1 [Dunckerocampus dactyliophorus]
MAFKAFTQTHVYERRAGLKEKGKSSIQCLECFGQNMYIGTRDATVRHLLLPARSDTRPPREGRVRKLGSSSPVVQIRAIPLLNHLLILWDGSITALNMFSLEPVQAWRRVQHVSAFEVCDSSLISQPPRVQVAVSSSRKRPIRILAVGVDGWDVVKEVPLFQEVVAMAVDGGCLCVATSDKYLLCNMATGGTEELFPHNHSRQGAIVASIGCGEFLLNGPGSLGMFVMKTGVCQRPPLQWPEEVLAVAVCFPYILSLQPRALCIYSALDQQLKQTLVSLSGAQALHATADGALVCTDRDIFILHLVPLEEQIQSLVGQERVEEALTLLNGLQSFRPCDSHKELHKAVTCRAGFVHFYQEDFSEAADLFIKGELDPREVIRLYPNMESCLGEDFECVHGHQDKARCLHALWCGDTNMFHRYRAFLGDFLSAVRGTEHGLLCGKEVDCALLRLYVEQEDTERLERLMASPNACSLAHCVPLLEQNSRYFALGLLYLSHGLQMDAIKTWVQIADGVLKDPSHSAPDVYGQIVRSLSQMKDKDTVWTFADWALQRNQEIGVQVFTQCPQEDCLETQHVLTLLRTYPLALVLYLEFLIEHLKERRHHTSLAMAYVTLILQQGEEMKSFREDTRGKLQRLLWDSDFVDVTAVYERVKTTTLHLEKAILLGRTGEHLQALQLLVHHTGDPQLAEAYCHQAAQVQDSQSRKALLINLLQIYLSSEELTNAAVDLLNNNPQALAAEILHFLPESWSVGLVSRFLIGSLRETFHRGRMVKVQKALAQAELLRHKVTWMQASRTKFSVVKGQVCVICQTDLAQSRFAVNLYGEPMHSSCI